MALVLDTGVVFASLDAADRDHARCAALLEDERQDLVVPTPVLTEVDQLLGRRGLLDVWLRFTAAVGEGALALYPVTPQLAMRAARLQERYADFPVGFVDAAVFVTCEELGERKVATLDRRHFSVLRTEAGGALEIVPGG
jgi:predicted nucleic acid-binding protein